VRSRRVRAGSAANVAALDGETGGTPRFVGQLGDDIVGRHLAESLRHRGVEVLTRHEGRTGVMITLLTADSRSRLVDRGASRRLSAIDADVLVGVSQLYLAADAFTEDPLATAVDQLLGEARERRLLAVTLGGPSAADLEAFGVDAFLALVAAVEPDSVVLNRIEHAALGIAPRTPVPGAQQTIVTAGARPTVVVGGDGSARSVEVDPVDVRDHTGAGDAFIAGYLASRRVGADAVAATSAGHRVAAQVLRQLGPTTLATEWF
jgi:2-dehydro-3-deoxygluconokinase